MKSYDYIVAGGGIMGMSVARALKGRWPQARIALLEKEHEVAQHASGRNSGVLHAGFYYSADSLKAKFTRQGNLRLRKFCKSHQIPINDCGKLVVASDAAELAGLAELKQRGDRNEVPLEWVEASQLGRYDGNAKTWQRALWSPSTATVDPTQVCLALKQELLALGISIHLQAPYLGHEGHIIKTGAGPLEAGYLVNCAGLYADVLAKDYGFAKGLTILPFKGVYLKSQGPSPSVKTNIYPVPNLANPFLGVHFTMSADGSAKIGPTAMPAFWRENYGGMTRFRLRELLQILHYEALLFVTNRFGFRTLALTEINKYRKTVLRRLAGKMVVSMDGSEFCKWGKPGIRAQLLDTSSLTLIQDFLVQGNHQSMHVLNAVSPAFTCSLPMADHVVEQIEQQTVGHHA